MGTWAVDNGGAIIGVTERVCNVSTHPQPPILDGESFG